MVKETFRSGELDAVQRLRLSVPGGPESVRGIVEGFNEQLQALLSTIARWYSDPISGKGESVLSIDYATLAELGSVRRETQWQILQNTLGVVAARADAIQEIDSVLGKLVAEAKDSQRQIRASIQRKLSGVLSGPELRRSIDRADDVVAADDHLRRVQAMTNALHGGVQNISSGDARRLGESIVSRIETIVAELAHVERMPSPEFGETYRGSQFISGSAREPQHTATVYREEIGPTH